MLKLVSLTIVVMSISSISWAQNCSSLVRGSERLTQYNLQYFFNLNNIVGNCHRIPLISEEYVPQGIHITSTNHAFISMYHKNREGETLKASIVADYDKESKRLVGVYHLKKHIFRRGPYKKYKGHVGGVALFNNYRNFVVPDGNKLCIFDKAHAHRRRDGEYDVYLRKCIIPILDSRTEGSSNRTTGFSFVSYAKDHLGRWLLWVGQFETGEAARNGMHVFAYATKGDTILPNPVWRFFVPKQVKKVQGVAVAKATKDKYILLLTSSYGDHASKVYVSSYRRNESYKYKYEYINGSAQKVMILPAGLEDVHITATSKNVWMLSESGAEYYQHRSSNAWSTNYPFFFSIKLKHFL